MPPTPHFLVAAAEDLIVPPWVRDYTSSIQVHCLSRMLRLHTGTVVSSARIHRLRLVASDLPKPASLLLLVLLYLIRVAPHLQLPRLHLLLLEPLRPHQRHKDAAAPPRGQHVEAVPVVDLDA